MSIKFHDKDHGFRAFFRRAIEIKAGRVKVGVLADDSKGGQERDGGLSNAELAVIQHFGTKTIPPRPFLYQAFDKHRTELIELGGRLIDGVLGGKLTTQQALNMMGGKLAAEAKATITAGMAPPLARSTLMKRDKVGVRKLDKARKKVSGLIEAETDSSTGQTRKTARHRALEKAQARLSKATAGLSKKPRSLGSAFAKIGRYMAATQKAERAQRRAVGEAFKKIGKLASAQSKLQAAEARVGSHLPLVDTGRLLNAISWEIEKHK